MPFLLQRARSASGDAHFLGPQAPGHRTKEGIGGNRKYLHHRSRKPPQTTIPLDRQIGRLYDCQQVRSLLSGLEFHAEWLRDEP